MWYLLVLSVLTVSISVIGAQESCLNGHRGYTGLIPGNVNILISAPHGGVLDPAAMPNYFNQSAGDVSTRKVAVWVKDELTNLFTQCDQFYARPFMIYNNLLRSKMDPNIEDYDKTEVSIDSLIAHSDYHRLIKENFEDGFMSCFKYEQGLLIDIQSHENPSNLFEIGYLVKPEAQNYRFFDSSIRQMASLSGYIFDDLIKGNVSLGGILEYKYNIRTVPSTKRINTTETDYNSGGYILQTHSSVNCAKHRVNAIQIRLPTMALDSFSQYITAKIVARAVYDFYKIHGMERMRNQLTRDCI